MLNASCAVHRAYMLRATAGRLRFTSAQLRRASIAAMAQPERICLHGSSPDIVQAFASGFTIDGGIEAPKLLLSAPTAAAGSSFDPDAYFQALRSQRTGHALLVAGEIASTQEFMKQHSSRMADGTVLVADRQSYGEI